MVEIDLIEDLEILVIEIYKFCLIFKKYNLQILILFNYLILISQSIKNLSINYKLTNLNFVTLNARYTEGKKY